MTHEEMVANLRVMMAEHRNEANRWDELLAFTESAIMRSQYNRHTERAAAIEQALAIVTALADERLRELRYDSVSGEWIVRLRPEDGGFVSTYLPKLDAIMWAQRMFDEWDGGANRG